jgi:hypothetical protein
MTIGEYSLIYYPADFPEPRPARSESHVETIESVNHFSWGFFTAGQIIPLTWNYMPSEQFDALDSVYREDKEEFWDPCIPGKYSTYQVQIKNFTGDFHEAVGTATEIWRKNCKMTLLIMGENAESS